MNVSMGNRRPTGTLVVKIVVESSRISSDPGETWDYEFPSEVPKVKILRRLVHVSKCG